MIRLLSRDIMTMKIENAEVTFHLSLVTKFSSRLQIQRPRRMTKKR